MIPNLCPRESSLLAALANGFIPGELEAHLHECPACQETKLVWSYLQHCVTADRQADIPPAENIWWRAQIAKKRLDAHRSIAVIDTMQKIALTVAAVLFIGIAAWQSPKLLEVSPVLLGGSAAILMLLLLSIVVVFRLGRDSQHPPLPRGM